jgi:hypothetical protein
MKKKNSWALWGGILVNFCIAIAIPSIGLSLFVAFFGTFFWGMYWEYHL